MNGSGSPLQSVTFDANTAAFPAVLFIACPGPDLTLHGSLLPATGELRDRFAAALGIPGVERVFRLVPWMGLDSPVPFAGIVDSAVKGARPVVRVDVDDDRSVAFAMRLVQAFLTRFRPPDSKFYRDGSTAERKACRSAERLPLPVPGTAQEVVPCCTVREVGDLNATGPERLCWRLVEGFSLPDALRGKDDSSQGGPASGAGAHREGGSGGTGALATMAQAAALPVQARLGYIDRPHDEMVRADTALRRLLLKLATRTASAGHDSEPTLGMVANWLLALLCDLDTPHTPGACGTNTIVVQSALRLRAGCTRTRPYGKALRQIFGDAMQFRRALRAADALFGAVPESLRSALLCDWLLGGFCAGAVGALANCVPAAPALPMRFFGPSMEPGDCGISGPSRADAWRASIAEAMDAGAAVPNAYCPRPGYTMLPLRYRFGLLLNPVDDVAVCLRDAQAPAVLGPRSRYTFDCSLLPLTQLAAGSAFTAFAIGAGKGFLLVVPADFDDDAIRSLAERAADRLGAMASTPTSPVCQKDSKPERRFPLSDLKIILSKACLCIMSKSDTAWSVSIPWGDSRLKEAGGASINRKTDQIRLLAALASAPSSEGRTVLALQRAQGVGSLRSESRFRVRVPRLRRGLARVLGPYVADESGTEGVSLEYRILPELPQGETGGSYELGILVTVEPDANVC